jgi:hypothetical protein
MTSVTAWAPLAVRHVLERRPRPQPEQFAGEVARCAVPGRGVGDLVALPARPVEEFAQRPGRHLRIHDEKVRRIRDEGDLREIPNRIVGQPRHQGRQHRMGRDRAHEQGVAVRRRPGDRFAADGAARPGAILHHDRLPEGSGHVGRDEAGHGVGAGAGAVGHDEADGPGRVGAFEALSGRRPAREKAARGRDEEAAPARLGRRKLKTAHESDPPLAWPM